MSSGTRSKRSASTGGEQEPLLKKMKPHDDHDPEAGEPIPVEQAAAAEGMLAGERVPLASTPKQEPEQQQLVAPPMTPMTTGAAQTPHTAGTGGEPPETPLTGAGGVSNKRGLASQIDLSNKTPTDPTAFNDYLFALIAHKAENNNFHVSREENPSLHVWMQHLKREYKNYLSEEVGSTLTPVQVMVLESLHVPLTSRGDDHWNRFYQLLLQYADRHGHVLVPRLCEIPGLGDWVTDQRRQYKAWKQGQASQLTRERREKLESVGFAWQVRNRPEWEARFSELVEYKKQHGDCKVPQHYKDNKALGKWVAKQREQHKLLKKGMHSFLTPYRLEKLNNLGFVWSVRSSLDGTETVDDVKLESPGMTTPAATAAAAAIAAAKEDPGMEPKQLDVAPVDIKKEEEIITEV